LTLIVPKALEDELLDLLLEHEALAGGFTISEVAGHGRNIAYQNSAERVRGCAQRVKTQIIMQHADAQTLLHDIRQALPRAPIVYYLTPVVESGSFL
jgi:nitrogen regulatory protein PII